MSWDTNFSQENIFHSFVEGSNIINLFKQKFTTYVKENVNIYVFILLLFSILIFFTLIFIFCYIYVYNIFILGCIIILLDYLCI